MLGRLGIAMGIDMAKTKAICFRCLTSASLQASAPAGCGVGRIGHLSVQVINGIMLLMAEGGIRNIPRGFDSKSRGIYPRFSFDTSASPNLYLFPLAFNVGSRDGYSVA